MPVHHKDFRLVGEEVTISYVTDPFVSYGQFRLENYDTRIIAASVISAWLDIDGQQHGLTSFTLYDTQQDLLIEPNDFKVEASATVRFLLGFPRLAHEPRSDESISVVLHLRVNNAEMDAMSPIKFERRIPDTR